MLSLLTVNINAAVETRRQQNSSLKILKDPNIQPRIISLVKLLKSMMFKVTKCCFPCTLSEDGREVCADKMREKVQDRTRAVSRFRTECKALHEEGAPAVHLGPQRRDLRQKVEEWLQVTCTIF